MPNELYTPQHTEFHLVVVGGGGGGGGGGGTGRSFLPTKKVGFNPHHFFWLNHWLTWESSPLRLVMEEREDGENPLDSLVVSRDTSQPIQVIMPSHRLGGRGGGGGVVSRDTLQPIQVIMPSF